VGVIVTLQKLLAAPEAVYKIKLTQNQHEEWKFGHYFWYIESSNGDIVASGYSVGSPREPVTKKELENIFNRWYKDKEFWG
jgi:hypothetical protein